MENSKVTHVTPDHRRAATTLALTRGAPHRAWIAGLSFLIALFAWSLAAHARAAPESFADLAERLLPTVVNIATTQVVETRRGEEFEEFFKEFFERRGGQPPPQEKRRASALGSGFIIDASGYIVTNHHVIKDADEITVRLHDDTLLKAELIGSDEKTDLALLKVEFDKPLPATTWGRSEKTRIGDWVIAIGNPFGLGGTVTAGIVSARQRDINSGPYDDFIQTDAAINRGNSGGPMFNLDGEVIGVNTAIFSPSGGSIGIGFAIPSDLAKNVVMQLRQFGEVRRGWLGVRIQTVTEELAEGLRLGKPRGALVASVTEDGPAEKGGILGGDVILEFDGRTVPDMRKLPRMVAETPIGQDVEVVVWRKGEKKTVTIHLGELDEEQGELHDRLKRWRKNTATRQGMDSSLVLNRRTLLLLAKKRPRSESGLTAVNGLLDWQIREFGDDILHEVHGGLMVGTTLEVEDLDVHEVLHDTVLPPLVLTTLYHGSTLPFLRTLANLFATPGGL